MKRGTIALALICKNEIDNFPQLLESVKGCFDEIHITDTGSTDGTIAYLEGLINNGQGFAPIMKLKHFKWINDFAAARNFSFEGVSTDYVMWLDLDDILNDKESFIKWRDHAMSLADYWFASYNYAFDEETKKPVVSFMRERVMKVSLKPKWELFIHEGCHPMSGAKIQYATQWTVDHQRTVEDIAKDKGRNLAILKEREESTLPTRLKYYLGKEYFDNGDVANAWRVLRDVIRLPDLSNEDRILGLQYLASASLHIKTPQSMAEAISYCHQGLQLDPIRAEYWCIIGDSYMMDGRVKEAIAYYSAAESSHLRVTPGKGVQGFIHHCENAHGNYPAKQLVKCFYNTGDFERAKAKCEEILVKYPEDLEIKKMQADIEKAMGEISRDASKITKVDDIVITTPPKSAYVWDDMVYKLRGVGGSETAAIEMANWLKKKTGRKVIVFNMRDNIYINDNGVEYRPNSMLNEYFKSFEPSVHIAWRHNFKITNAPTYLWCHDLQTMGAETHDNFDYHLCLSEFHKNYVQAIQGIPEEKCIITRNGINLDRFKDTTIPKNPYKIVWPSSPDRGLERAIKVVERAREVFSDLELHVYYGLDNLKNSGHKELMKMASSIESEIKKHSWIKYHGNVQQDVLAKEMQSASVWLYPASFIESFCITALESLASKCYPLVRDIGALPNTLQEATRLGQARVLDLDCEKDEDIDTWADELIKIVGMSSWKTINMDMQKYSWESVADDWIEIMKLEKKETKLVAIEGTV